MGQSGILKIIWKTEKIVRCDGQKNIYVILLNRSTFCAIQAKDKHLQQLNSFKNLCDRFKVLSGYDETIDIMAETEKMRNLTRLTNEKYVNYCNVIANRLVVFVN
jgi:hypothetical protein